MSSITRPPIVPPPSPTDDLFRVVLARQKRRPTRLAMVSALGAASLPMTGWKPAVCWVLAYAIHQAIEHACCPRQPAEVPLSAWQSARSLMLISTGNAIFSALGVVQTVLGGPWGLVCGSLLWSGCFVQAAVGNAGSRKAVIACSLPQVIYFLSVPFLIVHNETDVIFGLVVVLSGFVHGLGILEVWSVTENRFESEKKARFARHVAHHDPETQLPNRLALEEAIAAETGQERTLVVAVLGINRFAALRGAIGYGLSAELIRQVSARLNDTHDGLVARLSSSTLGLLFHARDLAEARAYAGRLQAAMTTAVVVDGIDVDVTFTVGLASFGDAGGACLLLERASVALDVGRRTGTSVSVFEAAQDVNPAGNLSLMSDMLRSLKKGEITNYYQPKYDLQTGRLVAVEALVRWHHPERGFVPPDLFITLAEETGRIRELTIDVLTRAIRDQTWLADRGHKLDFAVNLSGRLLHDADIIQAIIDIAAPAAARVTMEVTETAMMAQPEKAIALLLQFRSAGIGVSIDDYGTGLSSLAYLKNIPADELKIDRSFVTHLDASREDDLLVRSTIALAHSFGLKVVAEGVESGQTLDILRSMGCDLAQGYHMARPMPIARLAELLESNPRLVDPRQSGVVPKKGGLQPDSLPSDSLAS